ncbi:MAG: antibiotic biosynthesis monooxygenase [Solirubrobacterales bacterium]|nr:antibiotic biosynthesis monooxygenase [Solirubrobacterales bacterium]
MSQETKVVVVATVEVKPGSEEAVQALLETVITHTHTEEGNISYALHRDFEQPGRFVMVERWASREALEEHFTKPYMAELFAALPEHVSAPPVIIRTEPVPLGGAAKGVL